MTTDERLVIKQLSKHGELLDCVNCFPGKVTVLRAESESDLLPYRQAVSGQVSGRKFIVTHNNKPFIQAEQIIIGFDSWLPLNRSVAEVLMHFGVIKEQLKVLLTTFGLNNFENAAINTLSQDHSRRIEILCALYSPNKVLVLDTPFEPIASLYKDRFAELILDDTVAKNRITLVTRLCYRPPLWVGNKNIERVQVGSTVEKTIGFTSKSDQMSDLVAQFRSVDAAKGSSSDFLEVQGSKKAPAILSPTANRSAKSTRFSLALPFYVPPLLLQARSLRILSVSFAGVALLLLGILFSRGAENPEDSGKKIAANAVSIKNTAAAPDHGAGGVVAGNEIPKEREAASIKLATGEAIPVDKKLDEPPSDISRDRSVELTKGKIISEIGNPFSAANKPKPILDFYTFEVKKAILEAFNDQSDQPSPPLASNPSMQKASSSNIFEALRELKPSKVADSDEQFPQQFHLDANHEMDPEMKERQEEIRRRFLDALQRASADQ